MQRHTLFTTISLSILLGCLLSSCHPPSTQRFPYSSKASLDDSSQEQQAELPNNIKFVDLAEDQQRQFLHATTILKQEIQFAILGIDKVSHGDYGLGNRDMAAFEWRFGKFSLAKADHVKSNYQKLLEAINTRSLTAVNDHSNAMPNPFVLAYVFPPTQKNDGATIYLKKYIWKMPLHQFSSILGRELSREFINTKTIAPTKNGMLINENVKSIQFALAHPELAADTARGYALYAQRFYRKAIHAVE